jgi:hypothetical protein
MEDINYTKAIIMNRTCETCQNFFCIHKDDSEVKYCKDWYELFADVFEGSDISDLLK